VSGPSDPSSGGGPRRRKRGRRRGGPAAGRAPTVGDPAVGSQGSRGHQASTRTGKGDGGRGGAAGRRPTRREVSAGGVVYRREDGDLEVLLAARRTRRGDLAWGLAKGGIEPEESIEDAAVREVREETGIEAVIEDSLGETRYFYIWDDVRVRKVVHFFLMRAVGGDTQDHDDEMEDVRWFPLARALKRAAYKGEREVLSRAAERLR
jgi:8-oxo-dGTP pyrophosphatase MutT (NUDIX family)